MKLPRRNWAHRSGRKEIHRRHLHAHVGAFLLQVPCWGYVLQTFPMLLYSSLLYLLWICNLKRNHHQIHQLHKGDSGDCNLQLAVFGTLIPVLPRRNWSSTQQQQHCDCLDGKRQNPLFPAEARHGKFSAQNHRLGPWLFDRSGWPSIITNSSSSMLK